MFHIIATIAAALSISNFAGQVRAEQVCDPSSEAGNTGEVHEILMETAVSAVAVIIVFSVFHNIKPKKSTSQSLKKNNITVCEGHSATHLADVAAEVPDKI